MQMPSTIGEPIVETGFHPGELAVQQRAGVRAEADRLRGMLAPAHLSSGVQRFLAARRFAALTARDHDGRLWISPLLGQAGFLHADGDVLHVAATPAASDPLHLLAPGQPVGLIAIEFALRRRLRVNGRLAVTSSCGFAIDTEQAFGNCPSYIQQRDLITASADIGPDSTSVVDERTTDVTSPTSGRRALSDAERALVSGSDTFFLGTAHPTRGADASHKGGHPGFVRLDGDGLWWPDYAGNNLFNSMGNIAANPEAALLFIDFRTGATVQLSGTASLEWTEIGAPGDDGHTGRRVRFHPHAVASGVDLPLHASPGLPSPHNPALR
jgi:predicted pyridoxine 5'-phosphate oxidase superfamily flavin-nucleotide-binding protein